VTIAYRPDMLARRCGCDVSRSEVENASTFLASAVDEPSQNDEKERLHKASEQYTSLSLRGHAVHFLRARSSIRKI
jgi:hypothetical protein